jgi:hypothetical protein
MTQLDGQRMNPESWWMCRFRACLLLTLLLIVTGCSGEEEPYRKPTSVVTGQVFVDGEPVPVESPLKVECHPVDGIDTEHPTFSSSLTGEDGKFSISTYESGDGVPPGEYVLTFMWGKMNLMSPSYGGPDKLKGKYTDPAKSEHVLTVVEGLPTDLGRIDLTTDPPKK